MPGRFGRIGENFMIANPAEPRISRTPSNVRTGRVGTTTLGDDSCWRPGIFIRPFRSPNFSTSNLTLSGVTRNASGAALGSCVVQLFTTSDDKLVKEITSDPTTGAYSIDILVTGPFYIVAYKAGAPDVSGTTVNTLLGV